MSRRQVRIVQEAFGEIEVPVEIEKAASTLADVPRDRGEHGAGSEDVSAPRLTLQRLTEPEERWPLTIEPGGALDRPRRHPRGRLSPQGRAIIQQRFQFAPPDRVGRDKASIHETIASKNVEQRERQRGIRAG